MDDLEQKAIDAVVDLFDKKTALIIADANAGNISWGELGDSLVALNKDEDLLVNTIESWF